MAARLAKLEADVGHIQSDLTEVKGDVRALRDKIDTVKDSLSSAKVWALLLYVGGIGALLGVLARGFGWL